LALSYDEAAEAIGVSTKHFRRHVVPRLRVTMSGGRHLVAVPELERYLEQHAV
jgi:hypothetical protein